MKLPEGKSHKTNRRWNDGIFPFSGLLLPFSMLKFGALIILLSLEAIGMSGYFFM